MEDARFVKIPMLPAETLLEGGGEFPLPRLVPVAQSFVGKRVTALEETLVTEFQRLKGLETLGPGASVAIAVGSRGITDIARVVKALVEWLKERNFKPFIVPAMGSHGGPTAKGQTEILEDYGISETTLGIPVRSSLEVIQLGSTVGGVPVWFDWAAASADGVIVVNRVKPHTDFSGEIESGLTKMLAIGLGKHRGASTIHSFGFGNLGRNIVEVARVIRSRVNVIGGIAILEDAYKETARVEVVPGHSLEEREKELLAEARLMMPGLPVNDIDFLLVQYVGKDISGAGFDPNITGRRKIWNVSDFEHPNVSVMGVLDLSPGTHGNAAGVSIADIASRRVVEKMDFGATYASLVTATLPQHAHVPMLCGTDREVVIVGTKISRYEDPTRVRLCWIRDTSHIDRIWVSESLVAEVLQREGVEILGAAREFPFLADGSLLWCEPGEKRLHL